MSFLFTLAAGSLASWLYLALFHGRFWLADQRLDAVVDPPKTWPAIVAIVPARNEAAVIGGSLRTLLDQDYPGPFRILLVDDNSDDGTGERARILSAQHPRGARLEVVTAAALPPGWVGKTWAMATGIETLADLRLDADFLLLTDADVTHSPGNLRRLVAKAIAEDRVLTSLMVRLDCRSGWERLLIPAFVYFFQKLYPFRWVGAPGSRVAGAAGGCMLVERQTLERAGGITEIRAEIIDDCALARLMKRRGPIWLGLSESERSIRPYGGLGDIWNMVARTAYTQLRCSPWQLAAAVLGLALLYLVPVVIPLLLGVHGDAAAALLASGAWLTLSVTFLPTLGLYGQPWWLAPALPLAGLLYLAMTVDSARRHLRGRGAAWKGRTR